MLLQSSTNVTVTAVLPAQFDANHELQIYATNTKLNKRYSRVGVASSGSVGCE
jgi:hypothetical protein